MTYRSILVHVFDVHYAFRMDNGKKLFTILTILLVIFVSCTIGYMVPAYAASSILATCGPTQASNHSIAVNMTGFLPNTFLRYKSVRPDNVISYGGFSTGTSGENIVAINVGPRIGIYRIYIYPDTNNTAQPTFSSIVTLPCKDEHFTTEYYKNDPQILHYLLGIQPINREIKIGNYLVGSPRNALDIFNLSHSDVTIDQLAAQTLAAVLNSASGGAESCIEGVLFSANTLLKSHNYSGQANFPKATISEDVQMHSLKDKLEAYNRLGCG